MPKRLLPIEPRAQEAEAGCLAACAQMVLGGLGIVVEQSELNHLFELTPLGVPLSRLKLLESYGVQVSIHRDGTLDNLLQAVDQNIAPIVFIRTDQLSYWAEDTQHAVLVMTSPCPAETAEVFETSAV